MERTYFALVVEEENEPIEKSVDECNKLIEESLIKRQNTFTNQRIHYTVSIKSRVINH